ncbi:RabGAP/TBC [Biscogniauxia mediterranea]|nr:RabGAP/TBC [Biscogniauxia mediterranea]
MASLPTEELRSSYRSQLSASTAQGTLDAIDTIDDVELIEDDEELVDDDFSLSDIMGMYERGFGDDSAPEDNNEFEDSRPPTATSELNRRSMAMLLAISNPALASKPPKPAISSNANVRNSIAIRRGSAPIPYAGDVRASRIMTEIVGTGAASDTRSTQGTNDTGDDESVKDASEVSYAFDAKESNDNDSIKEPEDPTDTKSEEELISFDDKDDADDEEGDNTESITDAKDIESIADTEVTEDMRRSKTLVDIGDVQNTQDQDLGQAEVDAAKDDEEVKSAGDMTDPEDAGEVVEEANAADADESTTDSAALVSADVGDDSKKEGETTKESASEDIEPRRPTRQQTNLTTTDDDGRDRYGFRKTNQYITREQYDTWNEGYTEYLERRRRKWVLFLKENGLMTDTPNRFPPRSTKAKRFVRKGIPPDWRGAAWFYYAGGPAILAKHAGLYDELLKRKAKDVDVEAIERDLHRTFPDNIKFRSCNPAVNTTIGPRNSQQTLREQLAGNLRPDETPMISSLRRVLHAFSVYNPRIGYCQSLNFLAGLLLLFVESEEHAFWLLNIITRVYLPGTHEMSLEGANVDLGVLMSTLRESMPAVWAKIGGELDGTDVIRPRHRRLKQREQVRLPPITLCMTAWFMSCFIGTLPIETTLRVWDVFFYEGSKTLFRIALAIFKLGENEIRSVGDPMEIFQVVQTIPRRIINANGLMEACFKRRNGFGHLSQETIEQKRQERRNYVKAEKEKMALGDKAVTADIEATRKGTLFSRRRGS